MPELAALMIGVPLIIAALLVTFSKVLPRMAADILTILTAGGTTACAILLLKASLQKTLVYWFGGWTPQHGVAIGIGFAIDPLSANSCPDWVSGDGGFRIRLAFLRLSRELFSRARADFHDGDGRFLFHR